jgi:D-glycero-alpha-D-manno-heptose 1-phosphate guanylyltransferase
MLQTDTAIILAGGFGTRLQGVVSDLPKPMAPVANQPFLKYILDDLSQQGFKKVVLAVGYKYEAIQEYFGNQYKNLELVYSIEKEPLGTGGAVLLAVDTANVDSAFIINGDTFLKLNYQEMETFAQSKDSDLCIALKPMSDFDRYGSVLTQNEQIVEFKEKQAVKEGLINAGIYWFKKSIFSDFKSGDVFSFEKDIMEKSIGKVQLTGFVNDKYFIDIGIPEDYKKANKDFENFVL